jgi:hypothetical protein
LFASLAEFGACQEPIGNWRTKKRNVEAIPEIAAANAKKKSIVREVIVADSVKDLPVDVKKKVLNMGVDESTLDMHFDILCTVMHVKQKRRFFCFALLCFVVFLVCLFFCLNFFFSSGQFKLKHVFKTSSEANALTQKREFRNNRRKGHFFFV